jgi:hypothetical protein
MTARGIPSPVALAATICLLAGWSIPAAAQHAWCDTIATTSIVFGRTGGNIRPSTFLLRVDGTVEDSNDSANTTPVATVSRADVRRLARTGWRGAFATLPTAPSRPTRNPDAARDFVELRSACGTKHVEYVSGTGAPAFRAIYQRLIGAAGAHAALSH